MRTTFKLLVIVAVMLVVAGCNERTDKAASGGVILSIQDFDGLPFQVSVTGAMSFGVVTIDELTAANVPVNPNGDTSDLMTIEIDRYEIVFTRADQGTRVPVPMVRAIGGAAEPGSDFKYENLPILTVEQLDNPPLSDLQAINGGFDRETGSDLIVMNLSLTFYGRTLAGSTVQSNTFSFTVNFVP